MDIDLDFKTNFDPLDYFKEGIPAIIVKDGKIQKHTAGVYLQSIPIDPITQFAAIPHKEAEKLGFFKIDFLHISLLNDFETKAEIRELIKHEPDWSLLQRQDVVEKLFQMGKHYDLILRMNPQSLEDMADCVAIIRPAMRHLINLTYSYDENKMRIREELFKIPDDPNKYYFKRSHAFAYAANVVLQLHLIKAGII